MSRAYIRNEDLLINESDEKKVLSALNRIYKASKEIAEMGYSLYLNGHGSLSVMNVEGAGGYIRNMDYEHHMVVADGCMENTTGGDW